MPFGQAELLAEAAHKAKRPAILWVRHDGRSEWRKGR